MKLPIPINAPDCVDMEASQLLDELAQDELGLSYYNNNESGKGGRRDAKKKTSSLEDSFDLALDNLDINVGSRSGARERRDRVREEEEEHSYASNAQGFNPDAPANGNNQIN